MGRQWLLDWDEAAEAGPEHCGGKGWNLGRLHRYGFRVPAGGVLIAEAYALFMAASPLAEGQASLADVTAAQAADAEVCRRLDALQSAIGEQDLPAEVEHALRSFLTASRLSAVPLAVRSSATAEDSAAASFAGIHRSFLNCRGLDEVLRAVRGCYASLWTPAALAYRRRLGLSDRQVACAVVLCAMIGPCDAGSCQVSGVSFSCDPRSGRRDRITISAAPGLGDALVSGQVNPEEITVRLTDGHLRLGERRGRPMRVLTAGHVLELARLTWRVHWALGGGQDPQDIEWSHDGRCFWLLQARPVTRLPHATAPGLAGRPVCWSSANVKEVIPGIPTTMTWSILQPALWAILYAAPLAAGYALPPGMEMIRRHAGRLYFDLSALQWIFYDCFGLMPAAINRELGGHQPEVDVPSGSPFRGRRGWSRLLARLRLFLAMLSASRSLPQTIARLQAVALRAKALDLTRLSGAGLVEHLYRLGDRCTPYGHQAQLVNAGASGWQAVPRLLLGRLVPGRGNALAIALTAGSGHVTSAAHGYRLFDLARIARQDSAARDYLQRQPLDPQGWRRLPAGSPFRAAFARFLAEFGHRTVYEIEMAHPRWNEDPTYLLEQVRFLLASPRTHDPRAAARARRFRAEKELARHTLLFRPLTRWLAAQARGAAGQREAAKSGMVALWEPMRYAVLEVGRRLTAAGALDDPADVFHLSYVDVECYLRGEWDGDGARELVADRRARQAAWQAEEPADVFVQGADGLSAQPPPAPTGGAVWEGIALSAGRAAGPARVLRHPSEAARLQTGDVLVAPSTDPGWTPLFLRAAALVMEVGGYLSHGAIVAREYGIPAVSNLPGFLAAIRDGQRLTVDGDTGRVTFHEAGGEGAPIS